MHMLDRLKSLWIPEDRSIELAGEYMRKYGIEFRQMVENWIKKDDMRAKRKVWQDEFYEWHKEELSTFGAIDADNFRAIWKNRSLRNRWSSEKETMPQAVESEDTSFYRSFSESVSDIWEDDGLDGLSFVQIEYRENQEIWQERVVRDYPLSDEERAMLIFTPFREEESQWGEFVAEKSFWTPDDISSIPVWESMTFGFIDEMGVSEVSCRYISSGDYILTFPSWESLVIDANGDKEKAKKEILFIKDIVSTPIARRLLSSGIGKFNEFRRTLERKYSDIPAVRTPEWFIDLTLSEICRIVKENSDSPLQSEEKRVMENIQSLINNRWNLSETQRFLRNNRDILVSLLTKQGILYAEWNRGINIFHLTSRM